MCKNVVKAAIYSQTKKFVFYCRIPLQIKDLEKPSATDLYLKLPDILYKENLEIYF